jgi:hypothetical protein
MESPKGAGLLPLPRWAYLRSALVYVQDLVISGQDAFLVQSPASGTREGPAQREGEGQQTPNLV